jgi:N-(2-amino-2-carboxyethyl)-L-glutamate synthase
MLQNSATLQIPDAAVPSIGDTPVVVLRLSTSRGSHRVFLKLESQNPTGSSKDRTALFLMRDLERSMRLDKDSFVVESTSGNLGASLAMICRAKGYRFLAIADPKATAENISRIQSMGGEVEIVEEPDAHGGYLGSRLTRVRELCASSRQFVWTNQYGNWANPDAHYRTTGPEIYRQLDHKVEVAFVAVSTGGTLAGIARFLREVSPETLLVAVDAAGSVLFGQPPGRRRLTGIGSAMPSAFLSPESYDHVSIVDDEKAFLFCRKLLRCTGYLLGGSSGAVLAACADYLWSNPGIQTAVCLCPDRGENYASTIYNDTWLLDAGIDPTPFEQHDVTLELEQPVAFPAGKLES